MCVRHLRSTLETLKNILKAVEHSFIIVGRPIDVDTEKIKKFFSKSSNLILNKQIDSKAMLLQKYLLFDLSSKHNLFKFLVFDKMILNIYMLDFRILNGVSSQINGTIFITKLRHTIIYQTKIKQSMFHPQQLSITSPHGNILGFQRGLHSISYQTMKLSNYQKNNMYH